MCGRHAKQALICWGVLLLLGAVATSYPASLALDLTLTGDGEWWRLLTGHLVHLTWRHYLMDELALGMAIWLCLAVDVRLQSIAWIALLAAASVSLMLMVTSPVDIYGGLSGITAGLLAYAALRLLTGISPAAGFVLLLAMLVKIISEQAGISASDVTPIWQAHCAGASGGLVGAILWRIRQKLPMRTQML